MLENRWAAEKAKVEVAWERVLRRARKGSAIGFGVTVGVGVEEMIV